MQPVRRPPGRSPRTPRRDPGDAHTRAADRLHADRARRSAPPFRRLAPLRGDPRDVARRAQPAARGRADDAGPRRSARRRGIPSFMLGSAGVLGPDDRRCARPAGQRPTPATGPGHSDAAAIPAASAAAAVGRPGRPGPRRHCRIGRDHVGGTHPAPGRDRGRCHAASGHRGLHQRHDEGAVRVDWRHSRQSPTAPAICWPFRRSAASRPCRSCRSRS